MLSLGETGTAIADVAATVAAANAVIAGGVAGVAGVEEGVVGGCNASVNALVVSCTVCASSSLRAVMFRLKLGDLRSTSKGVACIGCSCVPAATTVVVAPAIAAVAAAATFVFAVTDVVLTLLGLVAGVLWDNVAAASCCCCCCCSSFCNFGFSVLSFNGEPRFLAFPVAATADVVAAPAPTAAAVLAAANVAADAAAAAVT